MNTQRTPQQASIEARPAREAWEIGLPFQAKCKDDDWYDCHIPSNPDFSCIDYYWRAKTNPARVITPGRWRAWRPEEVPLGGEIRDKDDTSRRHLIIWASHADCKDYFESCELLLADGSYSLCGVEEDV